MAIPKTTKTNYQGIRYYTDSIKGKVFVATFIINTKKYRKIIGYENDEFRTNAKIAICGWKVPSSAVPVSVISTVP